MRIDVICLTKTADDSYLKLCLNTLRSLFESEIDYKFDVVLVESEYLPNNKFYKLVDEFPENTLKIINPCEKFNYNRFLNIGLCSISGSNWLVVINNDLKFEKEWFSEMMNIHKIRPDLITFSPFEPDCHTNFFGDFEGDYLEGYQRSYHVTGWCLVLNKIVMDAMGEWDERFVYWCQDDDYAEFLRTSRIGNALVKKSVVHHLHKYDEESISTKLILEYEKNEITHFSVPIFRDKWNKIIKPVDEPKIKIVHLLMNPDYRSDITENVWSSMINKQEKSIECWRRLAHRFSKYVESYNLVNRTDLPSEGCAESNIIEKSKRFNTDGLLSYSDYGMYKSHTDAILNEFSENLDALLIVEGNSIFEIDPTEMISKIHNSYNFCKENNGAMVNFSHILYGLGSVASLNDTSVDYIDYKKIDHFMVTKCYLIMSSERNNIINKIKNTGWHNWGVWMYWNYDCKSRLFATNVPYVM
jgi:hypothetical protein